jgi:hypothetical protein
MALTFSSLLFPTWENLSGTTAKFGVLPWDWEITAERIEEVRRLPKPVRKELMAKESTLWQIYSTFWGENWFAPVSKDNVPAAMMAFAIDYDVPISPEYLQITCSERLKLGGLLPAWFETTLGGRVRAVWTFEAPVMMLGTKFANEYLHAIGKQLDVDQFLPGIDRKSFGCEMRWTNGGYWTQIEGGAPLPAALTNGIAVDLAIKLATQKPPVQLDKLEKALLEKHPRFAEFNGGRLEMKKTGRRFWDDKADNQNGAMVVDKGFYCVTGEKALVTWEDLLGVATVQALRAVSYDEATRGVYFDGTIYFVEQDTLPRQLNRLDMMLHLASKGFERSRAKGELMSGAEQVMDFVHKNHRIDGAAPLLFHPPGLVHYQNNCVLNISRSRPMPPSPKLDSGPEDFPRLWEFFHSVFANSEQSLDYFWAWWKRFYSGAINLAPLNGQAIFICGPAGCGKNFISELVLPASMGGSAPNPYRFLMGDTDFSDDILSAPILAINDEDAPPEHKKAIFEQKVKAIVANNEHSYHPKFMKKVRIEWCGRLIVTLNDGPKDVGLLPMLNKNTAGKMEFFLAQMHDFKFGDTYENRAFVNTELPFLLRWLLDTYVVPEHILIGDRFGVASYHDPFLVRINRQEQASYNLLELLAAWVTPKAWNQGDDEWTGTPTDLLQSMTTNETLEQLLRDWNPTKLSKAMGDLARAAVPGVSYDKQGRGRVYHIRKTGIQSAVLGASTEEQQTEIRS